MHKECLNFSFTCDIMVICCVCTKCFEVLYIFHHITHHHPQCYVVDSPVKKILPMTFHFQI